MPGKKASLAVASIFLFLACTNNSVGDKDVSMSGTVETDVTYVRCEVPSSVTSIKVKEGDRVSKGDVLISLDSKEYKSKLSKLETNVNSSERAISAARRKLNQGKKNAEKLRNKGFFGKLFSTKKGREEKAREVRQEIIEAKTFLKQSQFQKEMLQEKMSSGKEAIELFDIECPTDGVVSVVSVEPGESVKPGQILLTISQVETAYFRTRINGFQKEKISREDTGVLYLDEDESRKNGLRVRIEEIASESAFTPEHLSDDKDRLEYAVRLAFVDDSSSIELRPGMAGVAHFQRRTGEKK